MSDDEDEKETKKSKVMETLQTIKMSTIEQNSTCRGILKQTLEVEQ